MYTTIIELLQTVVSAPLDFFLTLVNSTDTYAFIIGGFTMLSVTRFVLKPIFGNAGSDAVRVLRNTNVKDYHTPDHNMR